MPQKKKYGRPRPQKAAASPVAEKEEIGMPYIADALARNTSLVCLNLAGNNLCASGLHCVSQVPAPPHPSSPLPLPSQVPYGAYVPRQPDPSCHRPKSSQKVGVFYFPTPRNGMGVHPTGPYRCDTWGQLYWKPCAFRWERLPCAHATSEGAKFGL